MGVSSWPVSPVPRTDYQPRRADCWAGSLLSRGPEGQNVHDGVRHLIVEDVKHGQLHTGVRHGNNPGDQELRRWQLYWRVGKRENRTLGAHPLLPRDGVLASPLLD